MILIKWNIQYSEKIYGIGMSMTTLVKLRQHTLEEDVDNGVVVDDLLIWIFISCFYLPFRYMCNVQAQLSVNCLSF